MVDEKKQRTVNTNILMVITRKQNLWKIIDKVKQVSDRFLVLKTNEQEYEDFFFIIYDSQINVRVQHLSPTIVHRKGRCFYTINALNKLVERQNDGVLDKEYLIDWDSYQDRILILNQDRQLKELPTKLYKIIN